MSEISINGVLGGAPPTTKSVPDFFKHVFNLDDNSKNGIMNILQYSVMALIPVIILNKTMQKYVPDADDTKGNFEIIFEIIAQVFAIFIGMLLIHRIITYFPTQSDVGYAVLNITSVILPVLIIILSLQTKIGEKVSIIVDRTYDAWNGNSSQPITKGKNVKVSRPVSGNQISQQPADSTLISSLPQQMSQQPIVYDSMYQQTDNPLQNASTPSNNEGFRGGMPQDQSLGELGAANDMGGAFGNSLNNW